MKKNVIAVLLSIVLTFGNVGVVPAYAADTPTINEKAEVSEESPVEEDSAVEEEPASQDEIEFSGDTSETESENANKDSANAEQDDEESEKDSGQKAEEIDNEEEQEKGQLTPQDTDSDADESAEENEVELSDETSKSAELQIDEESAFFLGKEFRIEGSSEVISFQEVNGEIIATWRKSNGYFSWPLYVTWDIPGKKFSQILSQYGASGYGLLSQNDISGATFKGVIRDDGKWNVSIYNAQGNRCVGNTFSLVDLNGWDTLVLEESYKCVVGDVISVKGIFHTNELQVNALYEVSDSEALLLSNKKVLSPNETGEENTWFITTDISAREAGNFGLTLTANGVTTSATIIVEPKGAAMSQEDMEKLQKTSFTAIKNGWPILNNADGMGYSSDHKYSLNSFLNGNIFSTLIGFFVNFLSKEYGGDCFGLSLLSAAQYLGKINLASYFPNRSADELQSGSLNLFGYEKVVKGLYSFSGNKDIQELADAAQLSQNSAIMKVAARFENDNKGDGYYEDIIDYLKTDSECGVVVEFTRNSYNEGCHAVVIEGGTLRGLDNGWWAVECYDPNRPHIQMHFDGEHAVYQLYKNQTLYINQNGGRYMYYPDDEISGNVHSDPEYQGNCDSIVFYDISKLPGWFFNNILGIGAKDNPISKDYSSVTVNGTNYRLIDPDSGNSLFSFVDGSIQKNSDVSYFAFDSFSSESGDYSDINTVTIVMPKTEKVRLIADNGIKIYGINEEKVYTLSFSVGGEIELFDTCDSIKIINTSYGNMEGEIGLYNVDDEASVVINYILKPETYLFSDLINKINNISTNLNDTDGITIDSSSNVETHLSSAPVSNGDISQCTATLSSTSVVYNGKELKPNVTVYDGEKQLISGTDYNITYTNNINAGTAKVTITGIGNYTGTIDKFFTIAPKEITPTIILSENSFTYSGDEQKPTVVVKDGNTILSDSDYSASYPENCTNAGTYVINVALKGNYTGSGSASFIINKIPQTVTARPWTNVLGIYTTTGCTVSGIGRITLSSSDPSIVKVGSDGWLEGCGEGTVIITVNASGDVNHLSGQTTFEMTSKSVYEVDSGPCGDNATWTYYNIGRVEINGTGTIEPRKNNSGNYLWDRYYEYDPVWEYEKVNTVIINEGITGIGREMFSERSGTSGKMSDSPETVEIADSVNTINAKAFYNCRKLERVIIGAGLTTLGDYAFSYCPSLKEIAVSSDNQNFTVVDGALYSKDQRELYKLPNDGRTEFVVSAETSTIKEDALSDLDFLQQLTIPKSVTEIKDFALDGSTTLSDIYYEGSASKWAAIAIGEHNDVLNTVEIHFAETDKSIKNCSVKLGKTEYVYDGKKKMPDVTVLDGSKELEEGVNYQLSYKNNTNAGTATVTIVGIGDYIGSVSKNFTIKKAANTITAKSFTRTYSTKLQSFDLGVKIKKGAPTYKSNSKSVTVSKAGKVTIKAKFIGKATITITAPTSTNYTAATKKITVTVIPTKTALSSVSSPSAGKMTVKWKKNAVGTGYQIQYSTSSKFTSPKYATITKNTTLTKTIGSLAKGKKYYVRIRTYKTVGSTKFYSGWSAAKAVTIKK